MNHATKFGICDRFQGVQDLLLLSMRPLPDLNQ